MHSFLRTPPPLPHAHVCAPLLLLLLLWSDRMHCAHVPCPRVPITHFFPRLYFCLVGLSSTSAAALSAAEYYKRWRAERGFVNGRRDVCQLTDQRAVGTSADAPPPPSAPSFASPHISRHHLFLPRSPCLSLQMNGGLKISVLSPCRGRTKSSCFLCLSQPESTSLLFDDPVWFFFVCALCGPGSSLPSVFQPGSAKSMAAELDKIRNGTNCSRSPHRISQHSQEYSALKRYFRIY